MNAESPVVDKNGMFTNEHGEVFFRTKNTSRAASILMHLAEHSIFASSDPNSMGRIFEGVTLSDSDKEIIIGRIRQEVCDAIDAACDDGELCFELASPKEHSLAELQCGDVQRTQFVIRPAIWPDHLKKSSDGK